MNLYLLVQCPNLPQDLFHQIPLKNAVNKLSLALGKYE